MARARLLDRNRELDNLLEIASPAIGVWRIIASRGDYDHCNRNHRARRGVGAGVAGEKVRAFAVLPDQVSRALR